jgi:hypothetical protein
LKDMSAIFTDIPHEPRLKAGRVAMRSAEAAA